MFNITIDINLEDLMQNKIIIAALLLSNYAFAFSPKVIYGDDNRIEVFNHPLTTYKQIAGSIAAQVDPNYIIKEDSVNYSIRGQSLEQMGICPKEKFVKQLVAARCSGFFIGKDVLVTSAQCIKDQNDCKDFQWVFDYKLNNAEESKPVFSYDSIYKCKEIIARSLENSTKEDYAIIRLDREVYGRYALKFRKNGEMPKDVSLFTIGTLLGLPFKIADKANVLSNDPTKKYFITNLDTYGGASGSPVFNQDTLEVEGIFVSGEKDLVYNPELNCSESKICGENSECSGERVTKITVTNIEKILKKRRRLF